MPKGSISWYYSCSGWGSVELVVGGLWAKGKIGMCQLSIKQLKVTHKMGLSLAPGGLAGRRRAHQLVLSAFKLEAALDWL